ncbi:hypothetical protein RRG08_046989 [Elysia crispata]|uniref:Uncharacterized protein n=1 Tax=Elysia crispata TaxID=231223 RepID=A0AAE1DU64_9GAST|nr:hypothetical protein RRG08_046989 [Elysia crispata]
MRCQEGRDRHQALALTKRFRHDMVRHDWTGDCAIKICARLGIIHDYNPYDSRQDKMVHENVEPQAPNSAEKTSWRIQEASKIFAAMRAEYEESKKLFIPRRYHKLEKVIEMFTAEPITQNLRFLSTSDSELQCARTLNISQSRDAFDSSTSPGAMSSVSSVSSRMNVASRSSGSKFQSYDSLALNPDTVSNSVNSLSLANARVNANSLWCRRQNNNTANLVLNSSTNSPNSEHDTQSERSEYGTQPQSGACRKRRRSDGAPSVVISSSYAENDSSIRNAGSAGNIGQACSKAYNFVVDKITPEALKHTTKLPWDNSITVSLSSFFSSQRKKHPQAQRMPVRFRNIVSTKESHDFYIPCLKLPVHKGFEQSCGLATRSPTRRVYTNHYPRRASETLQPTGSFSLFSPQTSNRSNCFTFESQEGLKHCVPTTADSEVFAAQSRPGLPHSNNGKPSGRIRDGAAIHPMLCGEQFFTDQTEVSPQRFNEALNYSDVVIDNIVLTIAHDHITSLRNEYSAIQGLSFWRRYKKMKAMIKSCMNVLKSD